MREDPRTDRLSTADLAAAGDRQEQERAAPVPVERDADRQREDTSVRESSAPLFSDTEADDFRTRWSDIQTGFVDEPRGAVEQADQLVAAAIKRLAQIFAQERDTLEAQWARGEDVSTEDLRIALTTYRSFFERLLTV